MRICLNGTWEEFESNLTVQSLLMKKGYDARVVAVAINFDCIPRAEYPERKLGENDAIEILSPQAGG